MMDWIIIILDSISLVLLVAAIITNRRK
ncbi:hypothetical protein RUM_17710 [Ruminococcus champanellensis 18P13 = JCM 17042]|uniref:Uncharacterized protein n=1 Tax=Ruminococcus champanellensis (strain DSM 18848 / JCM 17042 / KCTC 15320 / 18P13) TaxID=213810 RepID=D4LDY7_RUMC1|nr:hypothetical protein RUM_17710 [Ruminococcus champanellensis 18P13 = JCM 17042]